MSKNRKKPFLLYAIVLCFLIILGTPIIWLGDYLIKDWYPSSGLGVDCLWINPVLTKKNHLWIKTHTCLTTTASYSQITKWYTQRGWGCDGACENYSKVDIGWFTLEIYQQMGVHSSQQKNNVQQISVYSGITFAPK